MAEESESKQSTVESVMGKIIGKITTMIHHRIRIIRTRVPLPPLKLRFIECLEERDPFTMTPPHIPEVHLPEEPFLQVASALTLELNQALKLLRDIASGRNPKKFLM
ncbi:hypothetical protein Gorai_018423, partial [Gossypium raimondii]|nr:hypothetical protein [Gossypium raimondii]